MKVQAQNNHGIALILILWCLLLLMVIVLEFSYSMRVEVNATRNYKDEIHCYFGAQSGFQRAVAELIKNMIPNHQEGSEYEAQNRWRADQSKIEMETESAKVEVVISDENGKFGLNAISDTQLRNLISVLEPDENEVDIITDCILDWRDSNDLHRLNGAEDDYYASLSNPYPCKDGDFETVEELLLVRGVTPLIFYGHFEESEGDGESAVWRKGLVDLVSVYSSGGRVNVNTAPQEVLMSFPGMPEEVVNQIIEYRSEEPFKNLNTIRELMNLENYSQVVKYLSVKPSNTYSIVATGSIPESGVTRRVKGFVSINLRSEKKYQVIYWADNYPLSENMGYIRRYLQKLEDTKTL